MGLHCVEVCYSLNSQCIILHSVQYMALLHRQCATPHSNQCTTPPQQPVYHPPQQPVHPPQQPVFSGQQQPVLSGSASSEDTSRPALSTVSGEPVLLLEPSVTDLKPLFLTCYPLVLQCISICACHRIEAN